MLIPFYRRLMPVFLFILFQFHLTAAFAQEASSSEEYSVLLIGDAGQAGKIQDDALSALARLMELDQASGRNSTVVFLGDNIYPCGLNLRGDLKCQYASIKKLTSKLPTDTGMSILKKQLSVAQQGYKGNIVFVSGNHDWSAGDADGKINVLNEEDSLEHYLSTNNTIANDNNFMPSDGRPGPESLVLDRNLKLKLIALNSQWWLQYLPDRPNTHTMDSAVQLLKSEIDSGIKEGYRIIIVAHHPIYTIGDHAKHSFIGKIIKKVKVQDVTAKPYKKYRNQILSLIDSNPSVVYASGHDHNLQYFHDENKAYYVISGAGAKCDTLINQQEKFRKLLRKQSINDFVPPQLQFPVEEDYTSWGVAKLTYDKDGLKSILFYYDKFTDGKPVYLRKK